jgi:hypothetical protein
MVVRLVFISGEVSHIETPQTILSANKKEFSITKTDSDGDGIWTDFDTGMLKGFSIYTSVGSETYNAINGVFQLV